MIGTISIPFTSMGQLTESRERQNPTITSAHLPQTLCPPDSEHPGYTQPLPLLDSRPLLQQLTTPHPCPSSLFHWTIRTCYYLSHLAKPKTLHPCFPLQLAPHLSFPLHSKIPWKSWLYTTLCFWFLSSHSSQAFSPTHRKGAAPWGAYPWRHVAKLSGHFQSQS